MKFQNKIKINKPLPEVYEFLNDPKNLSKWMDNLEKLEHVSGEPGQPGAKSLQHYNEDGRRIVVEQEVVSNIENQEISNNLSVMGIDMQIKQSLEDNGDGSTTIINNTEMTSTNFLMRFFNWLNKSKLKKRYDENLNRLKKALER